MTPLSSPTPVPSAATDPDDVTLTAPHKNSSNNIYSTLVKDDKITRGVDHIAVVEAGLAPRPGAQATSTGRDEVDHDRIAQPTVPRTNGLFILLRDDGNNNNNEDDVFILELDT